MKEALEASIERLDVLLQIFAVVVAVGVLGEAVFGVRHVLLSKRLRALQKVEEQQSQTEIERLKKLAEDERLARAKIEQQLTDRHITVELRKQMLQELRPGEGFNVTIDHITDSGDDSQRYALEISDVFHDAKWNVLHWGGMITWATPLSGFVVEFRSHAMTDPWLVPVIAQALSLTGYPVVKRPMDAGEEATIKTDIAILVGGKPKAKDGASSNQTISPPNKNN